MPTLITKLAYTFRELLDLEKSGKIKTKVVDRARNTLQECAIDNDFWYDQVLDEWKEALDQIGFENAEISFSGFASQGDGASFTASIRFATLIAFMANPVEASPAPGTLPGDEGKNDWRPWLVHQAHGVQFSRRFAKLAPIADWFDGLIEQTSRHYSHAGTCRFTCRLTGGQHTTNRLDTLVEYFESAVEELRRDLSNALYRALEKEYEYRSSDEALLEEESDEPSLFDEKGDIIIPDKAPQSAG